LARAARWCCGGLPHTGDHTFGGVELYQTGVVRPEPGRPPRDRSRPVESALGDDSSWRVTSGVNLSDYHSAGALRQDPHDAHQRNPATGKGFYDTYDAGQGGSASRAFVLADVETLHSRAHAAQPAVARSPCGCALGGRARAMIPEAHRLQEVAMDTPLVPNPRKATVSLSSAAMLHSG